MNKIAIIVGALLTIFSVYAEHLSIDDSNNWEFVDKKNAYNRTEELEHNKVDQRILASYEGAATMADISSNANVKSIDQMLENKESGCVFDGRSTMCIDFGTLPEPSNRYKYQGSLTDDVGDDVIIQNVVKPNVLENQETQIKMVEDFNNLLKRAKTKRSDAQLKIGDLLYVGNELACHEQEAIRWWKRACSNREPKACFRLGKYYFAANKKKSAHYFKMAGDYGHAESQMMVYISKKKENNVLIN